MKITQRVKSLRLLFILPAFFSCSKEEFGRAVANSGPCSSCTNYSLKSYTIDLKKINNDPAGSKIFIEKFGYPKGDSSTIYRYVMLDKSLTFVDTSFTQMEIKDYTQYFKWKISGPNNDSLSGGKTPTMIIGDSPLIFTIKY
jgi:hypothetical protein